jgi:GC-rich sequence DNA-binding factor
MILMTYHRQSPPQIEDFKWFTQLHEISRPDSEDIEELRPEDDLPVNMCSTMLIPKLNALIAGGALDPYSSKQILRVIDLAEQIEASLGSDNIRYSVGYSVHSYLLTD